MTSQIPDVVRVYETRYDLAARRGEDLWNPKTAGLPVVMASTECWRGYVCAYAVVEDRLLLDTLEVMIGRYDDDGRFIAMPAPTLNGRSATARLPGEDQSFNAVYRDLEMAIPFTGQLVLGHAPIQSFDTEVMTPPWAYDAVIALRCAMGEVIGREDLSVTMERVREALTREAPGDARGLLGRSGLSWLADRIRP